LTRLSDPGRSGRWQNAPRPLGKADFIKRRALMFPVAARYDTLLKLLEDLLRRFALALIDLDGFKSINDKYGHDVGDEVLKAFSLRLPSVLRAVDTITRHGGDEFVALLANVSNADDGKLMGQKIIAATAEPIETAAGPMSVSCSIGISICPVHGQSLDTLRNAADQAMYHSKHQGGNAVCIFSPTDS
jgi:diguanylate cyclase (GGDEF)-like protein